MSGRDSENGLVIHTIIMCVCVCLLVCGPAVQACVPSECDRGERRKKSRMNKKLADTGVFVIERLCKRHADRSERKFALQ